MLGPAPVTGFYYQAGILAHGVIAAASVKKMQDVIIPVKRGEKEMQLRLRVVSTPEAALAQLLGHLGLRLPKGARPQHMGGSPMPLNPSQFHGRVAHATQPKRNSG